LALAANLYFCQECQDATSYKCPAPYRFCFVLFCHQSHATPGDHGAMYTPSAFRPQSTQRRLIASSPLPSVQACPKKLYSEDGGSIAQRVTHRVVVCQGRRKSKRGRPRAPTRQATTAAHPFTTLLGGSAPVVADYCSTATASPRFETWRVGSAVWSSNRAVFGRTGASTVYLI